MFSRALFSTVTLATRQAQHVIKLAPNLRRCIMATAVSQSKVFDFPPDTRYRAANREEGLAQRHEFAKALNDHGILSVDMTFPDPSSSFILDIISALGCKAQSHSKKDGLLWDITWKPKGSTTDATGKPTSGVWSHSLDEMSWHTDGSFEKSPVPFFGFHILHTDHEGGGYFRVVRADEIASKLSPEAWEILTTKNFDLRVPPEFRKDVGSVKGRLISIDPDSHRVYLRYRSSVLHDPPAVNDAKSNAAVAELQALLHDDPMQIGETIPLDVFSDNSILLMDNARYLHSRTKVMDEKRFLRRVRFEGTPGQGATDSQ